MQVDFTPDLESKLQQLADRTGRSQDEFVLDALSGYFDELASVQRSLDGRYDELRSGAVRPVSREAVMAHFREKSIAFRG